MTNNYEVHIIYYNNGDSSGFEINPEGIVRIINSMNNEGNFNENGVNYKISKVTYFDKTGKRKKSLDLDRFVELGKPIEFNEITELKKVR